MQTRGLRPSPVAIGKNQRLGGVVVPVPASKVERFDEGSRTFMPMLTQMEHRQPARLGSAFAERDGKAHKCGVDRCVRTAQFNGLLQDGKPLQLVA